MKRLDTLLKNLQKFDANRVISAALKGNDKPLRDANMEQLTDGIRTDGKNIEPPYALGYARWRRSQGLQVKHVDLKVSGALYRGIKIEHKKDEILFSSSVEYSKKLENKYVSSEQGHIFGVTDDNLKKAFKVHYKDAILTMTRKELFNGM